MARDVQREELMEVSNKPWVCGDGTICFEPEWREVSMEMVVRLEILKENGGRIKYAIAPVDKNMVSFEKKICFLMREKEWIVELMERSTVCCIVVFLKDCKAGLSKSTNSPRRRRPWYAVNSMETNNLSSCNREEVREPTTRDKSSLLRGRFRCWGVLSIFWHPVRVWETRELFCTLQTSGKWGSRILHMLERYESTESGLMWWHMKTTKKERVLGVGAMGKLWILQKLR
jgi:hypothetical protein